MKLGISQERIHDGWKIAGLTKYLSSLVDYRGATPEKTDSGVFLITASNIRSGHIDYDVSREFVSADQYEAIMRRGKPASGDLLFTTEAPLGQAALVDNENIALAQRVIKMRPKPEALRSRFLLYWILSVHFQFELASWATGSTALGIKAEKLHKLPVVLPPLPIQQDIVAFLDKETGRIDALVKAKEWLLSLLAEKRRALITNTVTRGLNPKAPLRDSGIPWLRRIPAHWRLERLRWQLTQIEQGWSPQAEEREPNENDWGVLKLNAVNEGKFEDSKAKALPANVVPPESLQVQTGDLLVTRANTPDLVGDVCYVEQARPRLILSDLIYRLRLKEEKLDGRYLNQFLLTPAGRSQIEADARGSSASMVKISQEHIKNWVVPLPPLQEQDAIVAHITSETVKLDKLRAVAERTIALLKERRAALIAAAVTGKLAVKPIS